MIPITLSTRDSNQCIDRNDVSSHLGFHLPVGCTQSRENPCPRLRQVSHYRLQNRRTAFVADLPRREDSTCTLSGKLAGKIGRFPLYEVASGCTIIERFAIVELWSLARLFVSLCEASLSTRETSNGNIIPSVTYLMPNPLFMSVRRVLICAVRSVRSVFMSVRSVVICVFMSVRSVFISFRSPLTLWFSVWIELFRLARVAIISFCVWALVKTATLGSLWTSSMIIVVPKVTRSKSGKGRGCGEAIVSNLIFFVLLEMMW